MSLVRKSVVLSKIIFTYIIYSFIKLNRFFPELEGQISVLTNAIIMNLIRQLCGMPGGGYLTILRNQK